MPGLFDTAGVKGSALAVTEVALLCGKQRGPLSWGGGAMAVGQLNFTYFLFSSLKPTKLFF